jgi:hypothetical protein
LKNFVLKLFLLLKEEKRNVYNILVEEPERQIKLGRLNVYLRKILKWNLKWNVNV